MGLERGIIVLSNSLAIATADKVQNGFVPSKSREIGGQQALNNSLSRQHRGINGEGLSPYSFQPPILLLLSQRRSKTIFAISFLRIYTCHSFDQS